MEGDIHMAFSAHLGFSAYLAELLCALTPLLANDTWMP